MRIGEAIVNRQEVTDLPFVSDDRADEVMVGQRKWRRILGINGNVLDRLTVEIDETVGIGCLTDMAGVNTELQRVIVQGPGEV